MFENDLIPELSQSHTPDLKEVRKDQVTPTKQLSKVYQKPLVWAAGHLIIYLEQECQDYAEQVKQSFAVADPMYTA